MCETKIFIVLFKKNFKNYSVTSFAVFRSVNLTSVSRILYVTNMHHEFAENVIYSCYYEMKLLQNPGI